MASCPPLTEAEQKRLTKIKDAAKVAVQPAAAVTRERYIENVAQKTGRSIDEARELVAAQDKNVLCGPIELVFDDPALGVVTVAEVIDTPAPFIGKTLADPIEGPEYGTGKARLFKNEDGKLIVNSFAHGSRIYRLKKTAQQMFGAAIAAMAANAGAQLSYDRAAAFLAGSRTEKQAECWRPLLDAFLAAPGLPDQPRAVGYPTLPDAARGSVHPLFDPMRPCIDRLIA